VQQRIETAEKVYIRQIPALRQIAQDNQGDLLRTLKILRDENDKLKQQIVLCARKIEDLREELAAKDMQHASMLSRENGNQAERNVSGASVDGLRQHIIAKGDTLSSISLQCYGVASRWKEIYEANRNVLPSPAQLKIGLSLRIP
jgi:nucleoid-associated protein YgaU